MGSKQPLTIRGPVATSMIKLLLADQASKFKDIKKDKKHDRRKES